MVEDVVEHLFRPLLRFVVWVLVDLLWYFVWYLLCHVTGWVTLRVVTLGRHPPTGLFDREDSQPQQIYRPRPNTRYFWSHGAGRTCFHLEVWEQES